MSNITNRFPIGIRRGWTEWQKDTAALAKWAAAAGIEAIDLATATPADLAILKKSGLQVGSVDLIDFGRLMSEDAGVRKELIAKNIAYVKEIAALGPKIFFTCLLPGDASKKRSENYALAIEAFAPIAAAAHSVGASMVVEGYPGGGPHYGSIACTPESVRAFIKDAGPGAAINYDPSHLIRLGVDHIRFLKEFLPHVKHVHGKDTDIDEGRLYEFGHQQSATFAADPAFGGPAWRYTIPGHGLARWRQIYDILAAGSYGGAICVELEDANFNGTEAGEKAGLVQSVNFLRGLMA